MFYLNQNKITRLSRDTSMTSAIECNFPAGVRHQANSLWLFTSYSQAKNVNYNT